MSTITSGTSLTSTVTLSTSGSYTSPLVIQPNASVEVAGGDAIFGPNSQAWIVENSGTVAGAHYAINLRLGGTVSNIGSTALIEGGTIPGLNTDGVDITGAAGLLVNSGTIIGIGRFGALIHDGGSVNNTGLIQGYRFGLYLYGAETVTNAGTITGTATGGGILLFNGGNVDNQPGGLIEGKQDGIVLEGVGTVSNAGTIISRYNGPETLQAGVRSSSNGSVDNTGLIEGYRNGIDIGGVGALTNAGTIVGTTFYGIELTGGSGSVDNSGVIQGALAGIRITGAGTVTNSGTITATHTGGTGIQIASGGTIIDSGTIGAVSGTAVAFGGNGSNLLGLEAGYALGGVVIGSTAGGSSDTLELLGSAAGSLTVNYAHLSLSSFETILFGTAGFDTLQVGNTSGALPQTISGFDQSGEAIDLTGIGADGTISNFDSVNNRITVSGSAGSVAFQLDNTDATHLTTAPDGGGGTELIACFARGTRILTAAARQGVAAREIPIEELRIGDRVMTVSGKARRVRWIGQRAYDGKFIAGNRGVLPIRVMAGALADGIPSRDLFLSPEHSLYFDGVLVQAKHLLNGATIVQTDRVAEVEYFHIELASHDVIIADGAPAETFVDCDNRGMFHNSAEFTARYPNSPRPRWQFCAPRLPLGAAELTAIRAALLARVEALGGTSESDPTPHLVADGAIVWPQSVADRVYRFRLPAGARAVLLASRCVVPAEISAGSGDIRRLGVALERVVLSDGSLSLAATHSHPALCVGFHADEATHRWTDGRAGLPEDWLRAFTGEIAVEVELSHSALRYPAMPFGDRSSHPRPRKRHRDSLPRIA